MEFWNNMAHAIRNARMVFAILILSGVLVLGLHQTRCTPAVVSSDLLNVVVLEVRRVGEELYHLRVEPVEGDSVWMRWYTQEAPPAVGDAIRLRMTVRANGERDYRVIRETLR